MTRGYAGTTATHPHGSKLRYNDGCHCDQCKRANRLHGVDVRLGRTRMVSPLGPARRLQALCALGWSPMLLGAELGLHRSRVVQIRSGDTSGVFQSTAQRVAEVYERLSGTRAPEDTRIERVMAGRMRNEAARRGWAVPLAWDNVDDPDEKPSGGRKERGLDLDDFLHLVRQGTPAWRVARQMGVTVNGVEMNARRHNRRDVLDALSGARPSRKEAA